MKHLGPMALGLLAGAGGQQVTTTPLIQLLALVLGGTGGIVALLKWWTDRKRAPIDRDALVQEITTRALAMNQDYLTQVEVLNTALAKTRAELLKMQAELDEASRRIAQLEERLDSAMERRVVLERELALAQENRTRLESEIGDLRRRIEDMEGAMDGRPPDD